MVRRGGRGWAGRGEAGRGKALLAQWGVPNAERLVGIGNCILGYPAPGGEKPAAPRKENYVLYV